MGLKRPFQLGTLTLPSNVFCAPLAGCSDYPYRKMAAKFRPGLLYCEMVKMEPLIRKHEQTYHYLDFSPGMHPIGAQLVGSNPKLAAPCAKILEDLGFDVIDLNCGCPVDKVVKDGSGSGMLKNPELIGEIVANMVSAVKIPVTVKIRAGWDSASITAPQITQIVEAAGAAAICIHGRTRAQGYKGAANWDYIKQCKEVARSIQVIGNGDIVDAASAEKIFSETGCDAILLARGMMGQPWLIEDIYRHLSGESIQERNEELVKATLLEHLEEIVAYYPEPKSIWDLRRVGCWFLRNRTGVRQLREALNRASTVQEIRQIFSS